MPYIVINSSNTFDPINQIEYATSAQADTAARDALALQPQAVIRTAQLLNTYSAKVTVTVKAVPEAEPKPETESPAA